MILSDIEIRRQVERGLLIIDPFDRDYVQPSSVDVHLAPRFKVFQNHVDSVIDPFNLSTELTKTVALTGNEKFILHPGEFVLASTLETFKIPDNLVARLDGKSSLGRLGLLVHATAGFIDPGFSGDITLELSNVANLPIALTPGMAIGQVSFMLMERSAERPYGSEGLGSRYQGQQGPTDSRYGI